LLFGADMKNKGTMSDKLLLPTSLKGVLDGV